MNVLDLFSGIGGFSLGLERAGMKTVAFVEIDPFCQKVLRKHWPDVPIYGDIKQFKGDEVGEIDLICGGFPCQPYSCAGKRRGKEDDRALWPEMFRLIQEIRPAWVVGENVAGFINMGLDDCISDLEREGYAVQSFVIPACAVGAPHRRDRVWIVGYASRGSEREVRGICKGQSADTGRGDKSIKSEIAHNPQCSGLPGSAFGSEAIEDSDGQDNGLSQPADCHVTNPEKAERQSSWGTRTGREGLTDSGFDWQEPWPEVAARLCRVDDGIPTGLDGTRRVSGEPKAKDKISAGRVHRLKALGNSVVPQIVEIIGRGIMRHDQRSNPKADRFEERSHQNDGTGD